MQSTMFYVTNPEAEHLAIIEVFPTCTVYLCDLYYEQAWEEMGTGSSPQS